MNVDIIVPIYNAYEDLQICLKSIYENTDLQVNRLVLINDNSPDERIKPFLDEQKNKVDGQVIVIHNTENKGFSNNINIGMKQSDCNDVILLNSDTVVTKNWVEKMVACAYSDGSIGTVTPLSNNATLCSVPNFCEENELPEGMSVERVAEIVEECSMKKYPRITVAHGFCMLVKREVINCIGYFDAETFGRGYGEENDFCNRAEQMGYIHVMCDDTYIYHSGTKSFVSKEKENYIREHDEILNERYPIQMHNNAVHCQDNPNAFVGDNIRYHLDIRNGKKNVLYLLQSDFREGADDNIGGTQLHVKHLVMGLRNEMNIFVAARDREYLQVTAYVGEKEHVFRFYIGKKEAFPVFRSRELAEIFRLILEGFYIDLVHVHHVITTSLDIFYEANRLEIPVFFTAHDFFSVCPAVKLLDSEGNVCIDNGCKKCDVCLRQNNGIYEKNEYIRRWREQYSKVFQICRNIFVPSESTKQIFLKYYPEQVEKIQVVEHGMNKSPLVQVDDKQVIRTNQLVWRIERFERDGRCPFLTGVAYLQGEEDVRRKVVVKATDSSGKTLILPTNFGKNSDILQMENRFYCYFPNTLFANGDIRIEVFLRKDNAWYAHKNKHEKLKAVKFQSDDKFRVAFIGGISEEKGGKIITEVIKQGPRDIEWYVFGGIGDSALFELNCENLIKTGFYEQEDLACFLEYNQIDAIGILSKWPETFSYTLSEALLNHIPVIVTDIGALGQRTKDKGIGYCVDVDADQAVKEVIDCLNVWKTKGEEYTKVKGVVDACQHISVGQMVLQYEIHYKACNKKVEKQCLHLAGLEKVHQAYRNASSGMQGISELMDKVSELENRMRIIDNSVTFKVVMKLTGMRIPFKQKIRNALLKQK